MGQKREALVGGGEGEDTAIRPKSFVRITHFRGHHHVRWARGRFATLQGNSQGEEATR